MNDIRGKINIDVASRVLAENLHNLTRDEVVFSEEQIDLRIIKILDAPNTLENWFKASKISENNDFRCPNYNFCTENTKIIHLKTRKC